MLLYKTLIIQRSYHLKIDYRWLAAFHDCFIPF